VGVRCDESKVRSWRLAWGYTRQRAPDEIHQARATRQKSAGTQHLINSSIHGKTRTSEARQRKGAAGGLPRRAPVATPAPTGPRLGWREAIAATVTGLAYELVEVERAPRGLLRITIDRVPGRGYPRRHSDDSEPGVLDMGEFITVDDCEQVTRQLQYALEVEGLDYARLEVSSPGLDRPLKNEEQLARFEGHAVSVTLKVPFQNRKNWQGVLGRSEAGAWQLVFTAGKAEQVFGFKFDEVREARLVPVVDFKGHKSARAAQTGDEAGAAPKLTNAMAGAPGEDERLES
jgi:ribosome maturation factor RimP